MPPLNRAVSLPLRPAQMVAVAFSATLMLSTIAGGERQRSSIEERSATCAREWPVLFRQRGRAPEAGRPRTENFARMPGTGQPPADNIAFFDTQIVRQIGDTLFTVILGP